MHKAQEILDAIYRKLNALVQTKEIKHVLRSSAEQPTKYPSIILSMGADSPMIQQSSHMDLNFTVNTDIVVTANNVDLDRETLSVRLAIHKAIMADQTLGLPFVINTNFIEQDEPNYKGDADTYAAVTRLSWSVMYRTNIKDPSQ